MDIAQIFAFTMFCSHVCSIRNIKVSNTFANIVNTLASTVKYYSEVYSVPEKRRVFKWQTTISYGLHFLSVPVTILEV